MKTIEYIKKTREYLDYLERHIKNVEKAFKLVKDKCSDMRFIYDDVFFHTLQASVLCHDLSKLFEHEFTQYRQCFYPIREYGEHEICDLSKAWEHHKNNNLHHWENWTLILSYDFHPDDWEVNCAHMVIDWVAMGFEFGDTAKSYYEKNKDKIKLPSHAVDFIYEIFDRIY